MTQRNASHYKNENFPHVDAMLNQWGEWQRSGTGPGLTGNLAGIDFMMMYEFSRMIRIRDPMSEALDLVICAVCDDKLIECLVRKYAAQQSNTYAAHCLHIGRSTYCDWIADAQERIDTVVMISQNPLFVNFIC